MKRLSVSLGILMLTGLLTMTSCQTNTPSTSTPNSSSSINSSISSEVTVTISILDTSIMIGDTTRVQATITGGIGEASFSSSDTSLASVASDGTVTAINEGQCTITASYAGKTDSVSLTVISDTRLDASGLGTLLSSSPYQAEEISLKGDYGLSEVTNVGVDKTEAEKEYYPLPDQIDTTIEVNSLTLDQIKTVMPDVTILDDYARIQGAFLLAKVQNDADKSVKIHLDGEYNVDSSKGGSGQVFSVENLNETYLYGTNDATITFEVKNLNFKGYFIVRNCKNFHINDVTLQLATPSAMTGTVVSANTDARTITLDIDPEFNDLCNRLISQSTKRIINSYVEFSSLTNAPLDGGNFVVKGCKDYTLTKNGDNYQIVITFNNAISRPGRGDYGSIQFTMYDSYGISIQNCEDVYVENLTMHQAPGMAFVSNTTKNLYVNRFNLVLKKDSSSLMTATADAMHFSMMSGDCKITNSIIENSHDDALNIKHGYWYQVARVTGPSKEIVLNRMTGTMPTPKIGDTLEIYNENTFEGHNPTSGRYTIASVSGTSDSYTVTVNERLSNVTNWGTCRATFTSNTPKFVFSNNIVRNKRNRGILVQVPEAIVENNTFQNVGHGSIQLASAMDVFNECTLAYDCTIRNNKFINNCYLTPEPLYGDISMFAISKNATVAPKGTLTGATIENNFFTANGNSTISLRGTGDVNILDNLFYQCSRTWPSGESHNTLLGLNNSSNISLKGNYNEYTLDLGLSGIYLLGMSTEEDVIQENNHNIDFYDSGEAGPEVDVGKLTKKITIDGNLSDWNESGATAIDIIGYSTADGKEMTMEECEPFFKINQIYLSYDDSGIYAAFDVTDSKLDFKTTADFWTGDCFEVFISTITNMPTADMEVYKNDGGVMQAAFSPTWLGNYTYGSRTNKKYVDDTATVNAKVITKSDNSGYQGEFFISFDKAPEFKAAIEAGNRIDIAFIVADAERDTHKRIQAGNVPHFVEQYKTNTSKMPQYLFN